MRQWIRLLKEDLGLWRRGWYLYIEKLKRFGNRFESQKAILVDILMARRGTYQRPFLHFSLGLLFVVGAMSAPILAGNQQTSVTDFTPPSAVLTNLDLSEYGVQTQVSEKPRDQVITYVVQKGDTLSTIAEKFGISVDTIKWANDIKRDSLSIDEELKIPPVTGVVHKVRDGETVYSIAKSIKLTRRRL